MNFVVVETTSSRAGRVERWPALYFTPAVDGSDMSVVRCGMLDDYFDDNSAQSNRTRRETCMALGLMVDYASAAVKNWTQDEVTGPKALHRVAREFARALVNGTIQYEGSVPYDMMRLYWRPKGYRRSEALMRHLIRLFRHQHENGGNIALRDVFAASPVEEGSPLAFRLAVAAGVRSRASLLAHLPKRKGDAPPANLLGVFKKRAHQGRTVFAFPAERVFPFLLQGFTNDAGETDETAQLVAILLFIGGLRTSEPFHLFVSDVQFEGENPWVFLHNPEDGRVIDESGDKITRARYLERFGLLPRNRTGGRYQAGWKGVRDDDVGTPVYWLPIDGIQDLLSKTFRRYLLVTRPRIMSRRSALDGDHPYLLVGSGRTAGTGGGRPGDPYTISAFSETWKTALKRTSARLNDPKLVLARSLGTTKHGARHYYGRFLVTLGVKGEIIQTCMHHRSYTSHFVYTQLTAREINAVLQKTANGSQSALSVLKSAFERSFHEVPRFLMGSR
ncbi:hypothetical protein [Rhizobium sp. PP-CC-3G-465]|uniref:hypothetical protein n=1 Tax=Rhizobium sp. PP-CC-3G-465 TaxID=2135648 RepID=UPI0010482786